MIIAQMFSDKLPIDTKFLLFDYNHEQFNHQLKVGLKNG